MTSIEWLVNEIQTFGIDTKFIDKTIQQAKEMHKKEMKECWKDGFRFDSKYKNFDEYYKETFKK
jgi:hypothetical protein